MKLKIDFSQVNMLLTRSRQRNKSTEMPVLTITKRGNTTLNQPFGERWFKKGPKALYYQIGWVGEDYYLFVSENKQEGFYTLTKSPKTLNYMGRAAESAKYLGKRKLSTSYQLTPVKVDNAKLKGFKMEVLQKGEE